MHLHLDAFFSDSSLPSRKSEKIMQTVEHLQSLTLDLPPSCIEFWPLNPQYAVVGTYNLEKPSAGQDTDENPSEADGVDQRQPQERNGSIILLRIQGDEM